MGDKWPKRGKNCCLAGDEMKCGSNDMQTFSSPLPAGHAHPFVPFAFVELPIKCLRMEKIDSGMTNSSRNSVRTRLKNNSAMKAFWPHDLYYPLKE